MSSLSIEQFRAAALDFDGTLANSDHVYTLARLEAFKVMAERTQDERYVTVPMDIHEQAFRCGSDSYEITRWVMEHVGIVKSGEVFKPDKDPVKVAVGLRRKFYTEMASEGLDAVDGAVEFVPRLWESLEGRLVIVTTTHKDNVLPFLKRHELEEYIPPERIFDGSLVREVHLKPHPKAYILALGRLMLVQRPQEMLAVEDTPKGIQAAKAAKTIVAAVATTHTIGELMALEGAQKPHLIVRDFPHLSEVLGIAA